MPERARILIVEDELIVAHDLQGSLRKMGFEVTDTVSSGEEAIEKALYFQPDLMLLDIRLQGNMDGIETARQIKSQIDTAIIYLTAYSDRETLDRAKVTEPHGYLIKPFESKELQTTVEMALHKHSRERERGVQHQKTMSDKSAISMDLMNQVYHEKLQMASYFKTNVDQLVVPILRTIEAKAGNDVSTDLSLVQKRLADIVSPFVSKLEESHSNLSPREIEICQLVREGLTAKEIAATLHTSTETVRHQRKSIRKKLGISKHKTNMRSYLNTI